MAHQTEVAASDVIKLMLQFCKENSLQRTMQVLQEESGTTMNTVDSVENFIADINRGSWDSVLSQILTLSLPQAKLVSLYEQIILEMLELRESETARALLRNTGVMQALKVSDWERYRRIEDLLARTYFDARDAYGDSSKERRRSQLASSLASEVTTVPPSRLLALVGQALKWQQHQGQLPPGTAFDLFRGTAPVRTDEEEAYPTEAGPSIKFTKKSHPECANFSPDGQFLVTGSVDGFVEVWDYEAGKLCKDLKFQRDEEFMMHSDSVLATAFSRDSEMLATASQDGQIKVWKLRTGQVLRRYDKAHPLGVTSLCFGRDSTQLLSGSFDTTLKVHGLKSGKTLKEFRGHESYINDCMFTADVSSTTQQIVSASSDGTVKVWNAKTTECLHTFSPPKGEEVHREISINSIAAMPQNVEQIVVCNNSPTAYVMTLQGVVVKTLSSGKKEKGDFVACCTSPQGTFIYCLAEDGALYCFSQDGMLLKTLSVHPKDPIGLTHHPHRNILATFPGDGPLCTWRPA